MYVVKRNGDEELASFDQITERILLLGTGLNVPDIQSVIQKVISNVYSGISTEKIDDKTCEILAAMIIKNPVYGVLATKVAIANLHKQTNPSFSETELSLIKDESIRKIILANASELDAMICHENDFKFTFFGFKTLESTYMLRDEAGKIAERPQYTLMRTALDIHRDDIGAVKETYELLTTKKCIHATPTLMNACLSRQLASCYLITPPGNTVTELFETLKNCAQISEKAGGIGVNLSEIRLNNSSLINVMRLINETVRVVSHNTKRRSAIAVYLEPWHKDVIDFLKTKLQNGGSEDMKCRDLFQGLWIPDLFMKRVEEKGSWTLFDPAVCPGLSDVWGREFDELYEKYEAQGKGEVVPALVVWEAILKSQTETGGPYMLYKDSCNSKSNQRNLGTIKCSNLCSEIIEYTSGNEIAVCNLASISLPSMIGENGTFDFEELARVTKILTRNLNNVIDIIQYPVSQAATSNNAHRPIGIGLQGLADLFMKLNMAFDSPEAMELNVNVAETMYFSALEASCELAKRDGPYSSYEGSPASKGMLQHDLWTTPDTDRHDWANLRRNIASYGLRNSLLIALMPTASTAQILGNNESIEPFITNAFSRRVSCGNFQLINEHLVKRLLEMNLWNEETKNQILRDDGSVKNLNIPDDMKRVFKTVWEISQRVLLTMAAGRGPYVDQSQSMTLFLAEPTNSKMSSMHMTAWKLGLKTGIYYMRSLPGATATKFTVSKRKRVVEEDDNGEKKRKRADDDNAEKKRKRGGKEKDDKEEEEDSKKRKIYDPVNCGPSCDSCSG